MQNKFEVIDLFAGPGGLSEGFASVRDHEIFEILMSVEMDTYACQTLRGRKAWLTATKNSDRSFIEEYKTRLLNGCSAPLESIGNSRIWHTVEQRVIQAELGTREGNRLVDAKLDTLKPSDRRVLIGGPPCQAYSLAGRSRNAGNSNYDALKDHRNFLYREYLRILERIKPAVFVMENVKGLNSARIGGTPIINQILEDLTDPSRALQKHSTATYKLYSLPLGTEQFDSTTPADFVIKCENYGVPQARHRVIIVGVRNDISKAPKKLQIQSPKTVRDTIADFPKIRAGLTSRRDTSKKAYLKHLNGALKKLIKQASNDKRQSLVEAYKANQEALETSSIRYINQKEHYAELGMANHFSRNHMVSDLVRYFHAATWSQLYLISPKGAKEYPFSILTPDHKNWNSGKFNDRFRCQLWDLPSTTIVSHISKDGHYFIHPDPIQCRSLTVREAAALQTFPNDYIFEGPQTAQYHQVGNAVPVLLARQIAEIVHDLLI